jgi:hypothetical protein
MGTIILILVTLFVDSYSHGFQKINCYNVSLNYLQVLKLNLKFVLVWKIKFKYLKVGEMLLQVFSFFSKQFNFDVVNIVI